MGILQVEIKTETQVLSAQQEYPTLTDNVTSFPFQAGSQLLNSADSQRWTCGSAGVIDGNKGGAIYVRKDENEGTFKIDFIDIEILNGKYSAPRKNPTRFGYSPVHYRPLVPTEVIVTWIFSNGHTMIVDKKSM